MRSILNIAKNCLKQMSISIRSVGSSVRPGLTKKWSKVYAKSIQLNPKMPAGEEVLRSLHSQLSELQAELATHEMAGCSQSMLDEFLARIDKLYPHVETVIEPVKAAPTIRLKYPT